MKMEEVLTWAAVFFFLLQTTYFLPSRADKWVMLVNIPMLWLFKYFPYFYLMLITLGGEQILYILRLRLIWLWPGSFSPWMHRDSRGNLEERLR